MQMLKQDWIQHWSVEYTGSYWPPNRLYATDHHPLGPTVQPVFNPPNCSSSSCFISIFMRIVRKTVPKALLKSRQTVCTALAWYLPKPVISSQKVVRLVKHGFPLVNPCWLLLITFFSSTCLEMTTRMTCSRDGREAGQAWQFKQTGLMFQTETGLILQLQSRAYTAHLTCSEIV